MLNPTPASEAPWRTDKTYGGMSDAAAKASWEARQRQTAEQPKAKPRIRFERTSTNVIMATRYPPLREVVPGYLYEGFTVLAGRQKLGKTWLAIDWAVAVATGRLVSSKKYGLTDPAVGKPDAGYALSRTVGLRRDTLPPSLYVSSNI